MKLSSTNALGRSGLMLPKIVYGTSYLGNLYRELDYGEKLELIQRWFECTEKPVVIDTAGKYGAGLALEVIGRGLADLGVEPEAVLISNKLGWYRVPLENAEPNFEPGVWAGLKNDCRQTFGYHEIRDCFEQGEELLGGNYHAAMVSVHDPDEYLLNASGEKERTLRRKEILDSYAALFDLKEEGRVKAVGIGSKDWVLIRDLYAEVPFDWVMFANSFTIYRHPSEILDFMDQLNADGVGIINSAVFHGGFLTGGAHFDYRKVQASSKQGKQLDGWRKAFERICKEHRVSPADAALHFGVSHPAITSIALNTSRPDQMNRNVRTLQAQIPPAFWKAMKAEGLIEADYNYL